MCGVGVDSVSIDRMCEQPSLCNRAPAEARSCIGIQQDAAAAIRSGARDGGVEDLAHAGAGGSLPQNAARDVLSKAQRLVNLGTQTHSTPVTHRKRKTTDHVLSEAHIVLPHELWAVISSRPNWFRHIFQGPDGWELFWKRAANERWLQELCFALLCFACFALNK